MWQLAGSSFHPGPLITVSWEGRDSGVKRPRLAAAQSSVPPSPDLLRAWGAVRQTALGKVRLGSKEGTVTIGATAVTAAFMGTVSPSAVS